mmetsp:Transcript_48122/g.112524  ORF Transcript_48122/g.112524 Transcript_48122/m.112524 type:complete len:197 (+) Transcript_48122:330-920(+)
MGRGEAGLWELEPPLAGLRLRLLTCRLAEVELTTRADKGADARAKAAAAVAALAASAPTSMVGVAIADRRGEEGTGVAVITDGPGLGVLQLPATLVHPNGGFTSTLRLGVRDSTCTDRAVGCVVLGCESDRVMHLVTLDGDSTRTRELWERTVLPLPESNGTSAALYVTVPSTVMHGLTVGFADGPEKEEGVALTV